MHLADGVLPIPTLVGGFAISGAWIAASARNLAAEDMPRIGVMSAAFFVASLLPIPLGPVSVHFLLHGLVGIILGGRAFIAISLGLALQALQFGHGGVASLGVNACLMGIPACLVGWAYQGLAREKSARFRAGLAALLTAFAVALSAILAALALLSGGESFREVAAALLIAHVPIMAIEAAVAASVVSFLQKVKPEMLGCPLESAGS
ncbi:MAG: Cobalt transport protein CbiM [bacterium]|nr:Cobalt transport protein CbiM [bacterium]